MLPSGIYKHQLMHPRLDMIEIFSTFMQFEADYFSGWVSDLKLRRSMRSCLEQTSEVASESFWALYWHRVWQVEPESLASRHLSAYLQESCYWAAQQMVKRFTNTQYKLSDYFQMAIAEVNPVLAGFKPGRGSSLKNYAGFAFQSLLRDMLRQRHEADICTDWALLRKLSKKRLEESLSHAGLSPTVIAQHRLAWTCFNALYVQTQSTATSKLPKPDWKLWQAVSHLYNTERTSQLTSPGSKCSPETIEKWLTKCAIWVRAYLYRPIDSLNAPKLGQESGEVQDDLPDTLNESLLTEIIAQEDAQNQQAQQVQINTVLSTALRQLDAQSQELLWLYYRQGITQQQIARQMEMKQVTVSRRLSRARESLLEALIQWSWQVLNISLTSNLVKDMSATLEEWLRVHYDELNPSTVINLE